MATYDVNKLTKLGALKQVAERLKEECASQEDLTNLNNTVTQLGTDIDALEDKVETLESAEGEKNVIVGVKVNDDNIVIGDDRIAKISVPKDTNELANGAGFQNATEVDNAINAKISSVYKPAGSADAAKFLEVPTQSDEGKVYNASEGFTANENFVEGGNNTYPAGTNVVVVNVDGTYKYDVLAGFVDLSSYATNDSVEDSISAAIDDLNIEEYAKSTEVDALKDLVGNDSVSEQIENALDNYVEKEDGKVLSTNDYTATDKAKVDGIEYASDDEVSNMLDEVFTASEN